MNLQNSAHTLSKNPEQITVDSWAESKNIGKVKVPQIGTNKCENCLYMRGTCTSLYADPEWEGLGNLYTEECKGFALREYSDELKRKYKKKGRWDR